MPSGKRSRRPHRLSQVVSLPYDRIFRYGGEEFLIFLPHTDFFSATVVAEMHKCQGMEEQALVHDENEPVWMTAFFRVAPLQADMTVEESIDHADSALYAAKEDGRNAVRISGLGSLQG